MEEAIIARLRASGSIAALVSNRIDWVERQHGDTLPAVVVHLVSPGRNYDHDGWDGLGAPRVQVDCYAASFGGAKTLARAVVAEMEGTATQSGIQFDEAFLDAERDMPVTDLGGGVKVFHQGLDFLFTWATA